MYRQSDRRKKPDLHEFFICNSLFTFIHNTYSIGLNPRDLNLLDVWKDGLNIKNSVEYLDT